jgi:hypothetical protein
MKMLFRENRLNLVERYNDSVGTPGPLTDQLQTNFINGLMDPALVKQYVEQCEAIIASRASMKQRAKG